MILERNFKIFRSNYKAVLTRWSCVNCVRYKSSVEPKTKAYSHTILTPRTDFPTRSNNSQKEDVVKKAKFADLYQWQRANLTGPEFVLHDGPPYANGDLHMGHAVNKIIKDINNRSQVLQGNKVHYVPGWDCHGLPIELKALQKAKKTLNKTQLQNPVVIRDIARKFALETVEKQKASFKSWGVMADWENECYLTLNKSYVQNQLRKFYELYKMGLIYRALKPVYWSPSSRTALAEAELEYDPQFKSKEVYVTFPIESVPDAIQKLAPGKKLQAIIWTTTPWSLVGNRAICYNSTLYYSLVALSGKSEDTLYVVSSGSVEQLGATLGVDVRRVAEFSGADLQSTTYRNKLLSRSFPLLPSPHVTEGKGTGLVHTAPAHGPEDFLVAREHGVDVECNVDEAGKYNGLDESLNGLYVLTEGQDAVIGRMGDDVIHQGTYVHSYPLDWRTKKPVLLRASCQWFIDTAALKDKAMKALDAISLHPPSTAPQHRAGLTALVQRRPYWCISRQRAWGAPLPVLYSGGEPLMDQPIIEHICALIEAQGADAWWTSPVEDLLPADYVKEHNIDVSTVTKGQDIMDIWLDSGLSWSTLPRAAQLYAEGVDQLTGWFQASLLTALPLTGKAPYESIFVHGFVVDENKRKMSKSIGNVVDPATIIHGGKNKNTDPAYGVDTLRWWVASHATQHSQIVISKKLLDDCQAEVIRIRNILKYLLGVISDLEPDLFEEKPLLNYFDQYMVKESYDFLANINDNYNNYRYNQVTKSILYFISNKVSGLYCHCIKDRLYCSPKESNERISAQLTVHTILTVLAKSLGPILPHLVEEAWQYHPLGQDPFFFAQNLPVLAYQNVDSKLMDKVLDIKRDLCVEAKNETLRKLVALVKVNSTLYAELSRLNRTDGINDSVLCEILEVSSVHLEQVDNLDKEFEVEISVSQKSQCLRCRKYNALDCSDKCLRCENVLINVI
ncbi:isoleucine--tRNA ligase, mitochondrial [Plutella xylostella]|uniref:isoleucine--tRNA ligase, mitochondrial n=1 Tax=Plutella xylostella TaxID=51655 RepID=UPI0020331518|nr:isoleucine--tRNA ligase, mitochondrial [Plutella xylostella]